MFIKDWNRIPRVARTIPFGYEIDPEDEDFLVPISIQLDALDKAKQHLKQYSYREVANWLTKQTGRYISHTGLRKRIKLTKDVRKQLQLNVSSPEGSKKRLMKSRSSKSNPSTASPPIVTQEPETSIVLPKPSEVEPEVLFKPNEGPQTDFLASSERESVIRRRRQEAVSLLQC